VAEAAEVSGGLTVVELAERVKATQREVAEFVADWLERGLAEVDDAGRWRLTPRGLVYGAAASDLRPLGDDHPGEIKARKRAPESAAAGVVRTAARATRRADG
jgi:DNA-binding IclR family transcriptional regulator